MLSKPVSVPICLPAFPLNNSKASGFFFCGMRNFRWNTRQTFASSQTVEKSTIKSSGPSRDVHERHARPKHSFNDKIAIGNRVHGVWTRCVQSSNLSPTTVDRHQMDSLLTRHSLATSFTRGIKSFKRMSSLCQAAA